MISLPKTEFARFSFVNKALKVEGQASCLLGYKFDDNKGVYNHWLVENNSVKLDNDFFGFRPLYYKYVAGVLSVSSDIRLLVEKSEPIDYRALSVFLRCGDLLQNNTPFLAIKILPPSSELTFDLCGLKLAAKIATINPRYHFNSATLVSDYTEIFTASVSRLRQLSSDCPIITPLSGGRDSRHIMLELLKQGQTEMTCVTVKHQPPKSNEDYNVAVLLARQFKLPHVGLQQRYSLIDAELKKNSLTNYSALEHSWFLPLYDYLQSNKPGFVFDGIAGDILSKGSSRLTSKRLQLARNEKWHQLAEDLIGPEGYLPLILEPELAELLERNQAIDDIAKELSKYAGTPNPIAQFYFWNKARRTIGSSAFGLLDRVSTTLAPFLDQDFYQLLSAVPAEFFLDNANKHFHDEIIAKTYPKSVSVRYENKTASDNATYLTKRFKDSVQQLLYLSKNKPTGLLLQPLFNRTIQRIIDGNYHYQSSNIVKIGLYLLSLQQVRQDGII